jgi:hypothetical protein
MAEIRDEAHDVVVTSTEEQVLTNYPSLTTHHIKLLAFYRRYGLDWIVEYSADPYSVYPTFIKARFTIYFYRTVATPALLRSVQKSGRERALCPIRWTKLD